MHTVLAVPVRTFGDTSRIIIIPDNFLRQGDPPLPASRDADRLQRVLLHRSYSTNNKLVGNILGCALSRREGASVSKPPYGKELQKRQNQSKAALIMHPALVSRHTRISGARVKRSGASARYTHTFREETFALVYVCGQWGVSALGRYLAYGLCSGIAGAAGIAIALYK